MEDSEGPISLQCFLRFDTISQEKERACDAAFQAWADLLTSNEENDIEYAAEAEEHEKLGMRNGKAYLSLCVSKTMDPEPLSLPKFKFTSLYFLKKK